MDPFYAAAISDRRAWMRWLYYAPSRVIQLFLVDWHQKALKFLAYQRRLPKQTAIYIFVLFRGPLNGATIVSIGSIILVGMVCATLTTIAFFITASMPKSPLRDWANSLFFVLGCGLYMICPVDLVPELALGPIGIVDDVGALVMACLTAKQMIFGKPQPQAVDA